MSVIAKVVHTSLIGFVLGLGFSLFTWADDRTRCVRSSVSPPVARPAAAAREAFSAASSEGFRTGLIIGSATAAMGSAALIRNGRAGTSDRVIWTDPVSVGAGAGVGVWVSSLPALNTGAERIALKPRLVGAVAAAAFAAAATHARVFSR